MADTFKLMTYKGRPTHIKMGNESFTITTNQKMGVKRVNDAYHFLVNVDRRNWQFTLPQANARLLLSKMVDGVQASDVLDNLKMFMRAEMPLLQTGFCNRFRIDKGKFAWKQPLNDVYYYAMPLKLVDTDTVEANMKLATRFGKAKGKAEKERIADALAQVGLSGYERRKVYTLSGGEQQRVALAKIIAKSPDIILADEPTGSLDERNRSYVMDILKELNRQGKTIVVVTHDPYVSDCATRHIAL